MPKTPSSGERVARSATYLFVQGVVSTLIGVVNLLFPVRSVPPQPNPEMGIYFVLVFVLSLVQVIGTFALR